MYTNGETSSEQRTMAAIQAIAESVSEISLRDLFAMNALNGIIANGDFHGSEEQYTEQAYSFADAMLKTRRKK